MVVWWLVLYVYISVFLLWTLYPNVAKSFSFELANWCMKFTYSFNYLTHLYCCHTNWNSSSSLVFFNPNFIVPHLSVILYLSWVGTKTRKAKDLASPDCSYLPSRETQFCLAHHLTFHLSWKTGKGVIGRSPGLLTLGRLKSGDPSRWGHCLLEGPQERTQGSLPRVDMEKWLSAPPPPWGSRRQIL